MSSKGDLCIKLWFFECCFLLWQSLERSSPGFVSLWIYWTNLAHQQGGWRRLFLFLLDTVNLYLERLRILKYSLKAYEHSNYITYKKGYFLVWRRLILEDDRVCNLISDEKSHKAWCKKLRFENSLLIKLYIFLWSV